MIENIVGTVIGGLISIIAVIITLWHNRRSNKQALKEENERIKDERAFAAKKDALLEASAAITRFIHFFIGLPNIELKGGGKCTPENIEIGIALNKLHFFCSLPTIKAVTELAKTLQEAQCSLLQSKIPAELERRKIQGIKIRIKGLEKTAASAEANNQALISSDPNSPTIAYNRDQIAEIYRESANFWRQIEEITKKQTQLTEKCRDVMISHLPQIYEALSEILMLARDELSFDIEKEEYLNLMETTSLETLGILQNTLKNVRSQITNAMDIDVE